MLAFLIERALSIVFEHRLFVKLLEDKGFKEPIALPWNSTQRTHATSYLSFSEALWGGSCLDSKLDRSVTF